MGDTGQGEFESARVELPGSRQEHLLEAQFLGFLEAGEHMPGWPHRPRQADLAEVDPVRRQSATLEIEETSAAAAARSAAGSVIFRPPATLR